MTSARDAIVNVSSCITLLDGVIGMRVFPSASYNCTATPLCSDAASELPGRATGPAPTSDNNLSPARCAWRRFIANISLHLRRTFLICIAPAMHRVSRNSRRKEIVHVPDVLSSDVTEMI